MIECRRRHSNSISSSPYTIHQVVFCLRASPFLLLSCMVFDSASSARVVSVLVRATTDVWTHIGPSRERLESISLTSTLFSADFAPRML